MINHINKIIIILTKKIILKFIIIKVINKNLYKIISEIYMIFTIYIKSMEKTMDHKIKDKFLKTQTYNITKIILNQQTHLENYKLNNLKEIL